MLEAGIILGLFLLAAANCSKAKPTGPAAPSQEQAPKPVGEFRCPDSSSPVEDRTPSGMLKRCRRSQDLLYEGPVIETWGNGHLRLQGALKHSRLEGWFKEWNQAGQLLLEGAFQDGEREGEWTSHRRSLDGKTDIRTVETYGKNHIQETPRIFSAEGRELQVHEAAALLAGRSSPDLALKVPGTDRVVSKGARKDGLRDGPWKSFYDTGKLAAEVTYQKSARQGLFRTYWPDGRPAVSGNYEKDKATTVLSEDLPSLGETMAEFARAGGPVDRLSSACGVVLAATKTSQFVALEPTDGHALWKRDLGSALIAEPVGVEVGKDTDGKAVKDCVLALNTADGFVTYVAALSGREYSKIDAGTTVPVYVRPRGPRIGNVVASNGARLRLLDWQTGKELWRFDAGVETVGKVQLDGLQLPEPSGEAFLAVGDATGQRRDLREWKKGDGVGIGEGSLGDERVKVPKLPGGKVVEVIPAEWGHLIVTQDKHGGFSVTRFIMGGERDNHRKGVPSLRPVLSAPRLEVLPLGKHTCIVGQKVVCPRLGDDDKERDDASPSFEKPDPDARWHLHGESGGALVTSGKKPASLLFADSTEDYVLAPLGRWLLPDVVSCSSGLRLASGGDLRNSLLYLACQGSDQIYAARLPDPAAAEGTRQANTLWIDNSPAKGPVKLSGGIAYYSTGSGAAARVCARDLYSGQQLFCVPWTGVYDVRDGALFLGEFGRVAAYDGLTGDQLWSSEPVVRRLWDSWGNPKPVPADGIGTIRVYSNNVVHVYRDDWKLELRAHDLRTGGARYESIHKSLPLDRYPDGTAEERDVHFGDTSIVLVTYGGVQVIDVESGEVKTLTAPGDQGIVQVHENTVFVANSDGVAAYRMSDGKRLWLHRIGRKDKVLRLTTSSDDKRALKLHVFIEDVEHVLDTKNGKEDYSQGVPEEGETREDDDSESSESQEPYLVEEKSPKSGKRQWVVDGFLGLVVGDGTVGAIDVRRDPNNPRLRTGKQASPKWDPKKLNMGSLLTTLKRDAR